MEINTYLTKVNFSTLKNKVNKYIVVHYTGNNGDTALGNCKYFHSTNRNASAHYFVDETSVYQCVKDNDVAWHCGASSYKHPYCRNNNSIGVELCSRKTSNYYFKDETVTNAVVLIKELMQKYNIPIENVIRHYDVTGKICPEPYVRDSKAWQNFKARLAVQVEESEEMVTETYIKINGKDIKINRILKDGKNYIDLRGLESAGFKVGYLAESQVPTLDNEIKKLPLIVDGKETSVEAVNLAGFNYVPIRSIATAAGKSIELENGKVVIK